MDGTGASSSHERYDWPLVPGGFIFAAVGRSSSHYIDLGNSYVSAVITFFVSARVRNDGRRRGRRSRGRRGACSPARAVVCAIVAELDAARRTNTAPAVH